MLFPVRRAISRSLASRIGRRFSLNAATGAIAPIVWPHFASNFTGFICSIQWRRLAARPQP